MWVLVDWLAFLPPFVHSFTPKVIRPSALPPPVFNIAHV